MPSDLYESSRREQFGKIFQEPDGATKAMKEWEGYRNDPQDGWLYNDLPRTYADSKNTVARSWARKALKLMAAEARAAGKGPSYDCASIKSRSVEDLICNDPDLLQWDRRMADLYKELLAELPASQVDATKNEQRKWLQHRLEVFNADHSVNSLQDLYGKHAVAMKLYSDSLKTPVNQNRYRSEKYKYEFGYPSDMSPNNPYYHSDNRLMIRPNTPPSSFEPLPVDFLVVVEEGLTLEKCQAAAASIAENNSGWRNEDINGQQFHITGSTTQCAGGFCAETQAYAAVQNNTCFELTRMMRWEAGADSLYHNMFLASYYDKTDKMARSFRLDRGSLIDFLKTFRFWDSEPKTKP